MKSKPLEQIAIRAAKSGVVSAWCLVVVDMEGS